MFSPTDLETIIEGCLGAAVSAQTRTNMSNIKALSLLQNDDKSFKSVPVKVGTSVTNIPLICLAPISTVEIESLKFDFMIDVTNVEKETGSSDTSASLDASGIFLPITAKMNAALIRKSSHDKFSDKSTHMRIELVAKTVPNTILLSLLRP